MYGIYMKVSGSQCKYGSVAQGEFCAGDTDLSGHGELELRKKKRC